MEVSAWMPYAGQLELQRIYSWTVCSLSCGSVYATLSCVFPISLVANFHSAHTSMSTRIYRKGLS